MTDQDKRTPAEALPLDLAHAASARESLRRQLQADVEEFLKHGGQIEQVPINVRAETLNQPASNYGRESFSSPQSGGPA